MSNSMYNTNFVIYKHTSPSGKSYIGKTKHGIQGRWKSHVRDALSGSNLLFHRAIRKYGPDSFNHEILFIANSVEHLNCAEKKFDTRI